MDNFFKTLGLFCFFINLSACMDSAITSANAVYDHRTLQTKVNNHYQQFTLYEALKSNPAIDTKSDLSVTIQDNIDLVLGQTPTKASFQAIEQTLNAYPDKADKLNFVTVQPKLSWSQQLNDMWITAEVKSQYITSNEINPDKIKVITENHVVYLMGIAPREEANKAIEIASKTKGVEKVVTALYFQDASKV